MDGNLHKTFGRLFLQQLKDPSKEQMFQELDRKALDELSKGIYFECEEHGPESYRMCGSYFYMGELFKQRAQRSQSQEEAAPWEINARAFYVKIIEIWRKHILNHDLDPS